MQRAAPGARDAIGASGPVHIVIIATIASPPAGFSLQQVWLPVSNASALVREPGQSLEKNVPGRLANIQARIRVGHARQPTSRPSPVAELQIFRIWRFLAWRQTRCELLYGFVY